MSSYVCRIHGLPCEDEMCSACDAEIQQQMEEGDPRDSRQDEPRKWPLLTQQELDLEVAKDAYRVKQIQEFNSLTREKQEFLVEEARKRGTNVADEIVRQQGYDPVEPFEPSTETGLRRS